VTISESRPQGRAAGKGFPTTDGYIAAIAATHNFGVASRDASAFIAAELTVINPCVGMV
jgi:predicted nucleic acid-binding protein